MDKPLITVVYKLANGKRIRLEVTSEVGDFLEQSDRQIRSQRRQDRRYLIYTGCIDEFDDHPMTAAQEDVADLLIRMDSYRRLYAAIDELSEVQKRRLLLHFEDNLTYREIAKMERVHHGTIGRSVERAIKQLRNHLGK